MLDKALFPLGATVGTPGALQAISDADQDPFDFVRRHVHGDWGDMPPEDADENLKGLDPVAPGRLMSAYQTSLGVKIWCITEWDRSVTTLLLPEEY